MTEQTAQTTTTKPQPSSKSSPELAAIDREELRRLYEESCTRIKEGSVVKGKIVRVTTDEVYVDIGYKSEGIVPLSEFGDPAEIKPGDEIDVFWNQKKTPTEWSSFPGSKPRER